MFHFEQREEKLISNACFIWRLLKRLGLAFAFLLLPLAVGIAGYHWIGGLGLVDSFLNASMILGGMGPVDPMTSTAAKVFSGCYALFSGIVFVALAGFMVAPVLHRVLHHFHYEEDQKEKEGS